MARGKRGNKGGNAARNRAQPRDFFDYEDLGPNFSSGFSGKSSGGIFADFITKMEWEAFVEDFLEWFHTMWAIIRMQFFPSGAEREAKREHDRRSEDYDHDHREHDHSSQQRGIRNIVSLQNAAF